ncbi:hypothetical protein EDD18DRAFT_1357514 [Armillaria luteobubalina]|uniref:Peptidase C14 caspase domain-containing protein n=1 Tax=Armillaria luteobubalina TaxID=153913 RepID=A0AA39PZM4_9AGAR|nr:hypothetical protein EDD18DRAFT_1357514 [Armillaria luteobubalina]
MITKDPYIPFAAWSPHSHACQPELDRLAELEKRLAQKFGMVSSQDIIQIDSVAVLEEATRHANLPQRGLRSAILAFFRKLKGSAARSKPVKELKKLYRMQSQLTHEGYEFGDVSSSLPRSLTRGAPHCVDASQFWAVLIGIDVYESSPLQGCVLDALLMKKFLIDDLGVPKEWIQSLLRFHNCIPDDPITPSRANIVNTLYSLIHNDEIRLGDNIIIYYAGHGSTYRCSDCAPRDDPASLPKDGNAPQSCASQHNDASGCRSSTCPIEALCPINRDTLDSQERGIPDISDREVNTLFTKISRVKGHKITFFADCCHASGTTRGLTSLPAARMCAMAPAHKTDIKDMLRAADESLGHLPCYRPVSSKNWNPDMSSHVIMVALMCSVTGSAQRKTKL